MKIYKVTLKHYFQSGEREVEYNILLEEDDLNDVEGFKIIPDIRAVEYAMYKFFKSYILIKGSKLAVTNVEEINK